MPANFNCTQSLHAIIGRFVPPQKRSEGPERKIVGFRSAFTILTVRFRTVGPSDPSCPSAGPAASPPRLQRCGWRGSAQSARRASFGSSRAPTPPPPPRSWSCGQGSAAADRVSPPRGDKPRSKRGHLQRSRLTPTSHLAATCAARFPHKRQQGQADSGLNDTVRINRHSYRIVLDGFRVRS